MIFIQSRSEKIVQVEDKTRIDVNETFLSPDEAAITLVEIEPEASAGFTDVTSTKLLDWAYLTNGTKTVTVRITTDSTPVTKSFDIEVLNEADDRLFSNDDDIRKLEIDIYRFLRPGRASFLDMHREAQTIVMDDLDQRGFTDGDGNRLNKNDLFDVQEVREWSKYTTLMLIYKSVQSEVGDVYEQKALNYENMAKKQQTRACIRLDVNQDGISETSLNMTTTELYRR